MTTDSNGNALIDTLLSTPTIVGNYLTATATTLPFNTGNTSEFSPGTQITAAQLADLALTITDNPDPATLNGSLTYTVTVTNHGPNPATNVQYTQSLPTGATLNNVSTTQGTITATGTTLSGNLGTIAANATVTITIDLTPTSTGTLTTGASVSSPEIDTDSTNNSATETTTVDIPADLQVTLTTDPTSGVFGQQLAFVAYVTNNGPGTARDIQLTSVLPPNVTYVGAFTGQGSAQRQGNSVVANLGSLISGTTTAVRIIVIPNTTDTINQTVAVSGSVLDTNTNNNSASTTTTVLPAADLAVRVDSSSPTLVSGGEVTYTITLTNNGPQTANAVNLKATPLPGVVFLDGGQLSPSGTGTLNPDGTVDATIASIDSGQSVTLTLHGNAASNFSGASGISATASTDQAGDLVASNNTASVDTLVNSVDVSISQVANPVPALVGQDLTFQILVVNNGPADATNVQVFDTLPKNANVVSLSTTGTVTHDTQNNRDIIQFASIPAGTSQTITLVVRPTQSGSIANDASVGIDEFDANATDNRTVAVVPVSPADLAVSIQTSAGSVLAGDNLTYTAYILNRGPTDVTSNVSFNDVLPAGLVVKQITTSKGTIANYNGTIIAELGPLASNQQEVVTIVVSPTAAGTLKNTVKVGSSQYDDDVSNNAASANVQATNAPGQIALSQALYLVREDAGQATITLVRSHGNAGSVSVHYAIADGSAHAGVNYQASSGSVVFQPGETTKTFTVPILHDGVTTGPLGATITLSDPTGGASIGSRSSATLGIINTDIDVTPPTITDISLLGPSNLIVGVRLTFSEPLDPTSATNPANYTLLTSSGQPIPLATPLDDIANNAVILLPAGPLPAGPSFYYVVVHAQAPGGVSDTSGNLLDGDLNGQAGGDFVASFARGSRLTYLDSDSDVVSLNINNGGFLDVIRGSSGAAEVLRVNGAPNGRSVLSGSVLRNRFQGNGRAYLGQIQGADFGSIRSRLTTPPFYEAAQLQTVASTSLLHPVVPQASMARQFSLRRYRRG